MPGSDAKHILVVANRTAATPTLLNEVRRRAAAGPCTFALLIPEVPRADHDWTLDRALPIIASAAGGPVEALASGSDPFAAVRQALGASRFDEVLVSTLPRRASRWLRQDLPRRIQQLGVPVTVVSAEERKESLADTVRRLGVPGSEGMHGAGPRGPVDRHRD
jgi:hypothetical protein